MCASDHQPTARATHPPEKIVTTRSAAQAATRSRLRRAQEEACRARRPREAGGAPGRDTYAVASTAVSGSVSGAAL